MVLPQVAYDDDDRRLAVEGQLQRLDLDPHRRAVGADELALGRRVSCPHRCGLEVRDARSHHLVQRGGDDVEGRPSEEIGGGVMAQHREQCGVDVGQLAGAVDEHADRELLDECPEARLGPQAGFFCLPPRGHDQRDAVGRMVQDGAESARFRLQRRAGHLGDLRREHQVRGPMARLDPRDRGMHDERGTILGALAPRRESPFREGAEHLAFGGGRLGPEVGHAVLKQRLVRPAELSRRSAIGGEDPARRRVARPARHRTRIQHGDERADPVGRRALVERHGRPTVSSRDRSLICFEPEGCAGAHCRTKVNDATA